MGISSRNAKLFFHLYSTLSTLQINRALESAGMNYGDWNEFCADMKKLPPTMSELLPLSKIVLPEDSNAADDDGIDWSIVYQFKSNTLDLIKQEVSYLHEDNLVYFENRPIDVVGKVFDHQEYTYEIVDVDVEQNEQPLCTVIRLELNGSQLESYDYASFKDAMTTPKAGYYSLDEDQAGRDFPYQWENYTRSNPGNGRLYAKNIEGITDGTLIGFDWVPLLSIIEEVKA